MSCQFISFDIGKFKIANEQLPFKGNINEKTPSVIMSLPIAHQPETSAKIVDSFYLSNAANKSRNSINLAH